ncbi:MAG: hypothetical protein IT425_06630 [Pirellulales bacterium]|nr:hypothetical protein [Pirellulales bacterium]
MPDPLELDDDGNTTWSPWAIAAAALLLLLAGIIVVGTLRGCFFVDPQQAAKAEEVKKKKEDEKKKKKSDFELRPPIVLPSEPKTPLPLAKPGHWQTVRQDMRANYRDFVGDSRLTVTDTKGRPYPVEKTPFHVRAARPVLLAKARVKSTDTTLFIPETSQPMRLVPDLEERGLGFALNQGFTPLTPMPSYQYHFVILAKEPTRYAFIKSLDSVQPPFDGETEADDTQDPVLYSVVQLATGRSISLPDNPLTWTSTAYLLWDEVDPGDPLSPEQEKAILDWVHWGGQLIINGPDSLDLLKGSFLEPFLPATNGGTRKIEANDPAIAQLNKHWLISTTKDPGEPLKVNSPWSGITLKLHPDAKPLPNTGELLVERRVGRGRIVVSAMQLSERDLINWRSGFNSLFNACVMRREPRKFIPGAFGDVTLMWKNDKFAGHRLDAALNTHLRYFARDLDVDTSYQFQDVTDPAFLNQQFNAAGQPVTLREYRPPTNAGGLGAWRDFNATAVAARDALRKAAGVEVPGSEFVLLCLGAYLVVLVPINWVIFRAIGRIEWAWIAAPIIALIGTWVIVQRAQLDIGFVRAHTEIGILEQQPEHPRAHLSRYTALYASLSTTYDFQSENPTTLIAPFPRDVNFQMLIGEGLSGVDFQRYDDVRLVGVPISSNSTGMIHSEQMHTLDGPIRLGKSTALGNSQIENRSKLDLHSVCVVYKPTTAEAARGRRLEGRWIGSLLAGQSASTTERMSSLPENKVAFEDERKSETNTFRTPQLDLETMFKLALDPKYIDEGELRLVARCDEVLPGETISPAASQLRGATLVVAHLAYSPLPPPEKDLNTRQDIKRTNDKPDTDSVDLFK